YLENLTMGGSPFRGSWATFEANFQRRFMPLSTTDAAQDALKKIRQGKDSVTEYMSKFDQDTSQSGWSSDDHRQCFYIGFNEKVKDFLCLTNMPTNPFTDLRGALLQID